MLCKTKVIEKKEDEQNVQDPKHCTCKDFTVFHIFWNFMFTNCITLRVSGFITELCIQV